jgi:CHAT domain-containing protein
LGSAENDYANFLDDVARSEPLYAGVRALKVPSDDEVRQRLPADTALVEYVIGDNELVIFVLTREGLRAKSIPAKHDALTSRVETLRELMLRNTTNEWKLPAAALYKTLIDPIESEGWLKTSKQIYLIPHAILHYVPFAVLHDRNQFLIDKYILSYLPAAAALVHRESAAQPGTSILAMAPASSRLQYTRMESESISDFFPKQRTVLLGMHATESSFKELANRYDLIHLATHAYFNKANPLLSGLVLESDANEDGKLEVHEILDLRLKANLVTLSACDTAVGGGYFSEVPPGDDLVGLTRAK